MLCSESLLLVSEAGGILTFLSFVHTLLWPENYHLWSESLLLDSKVGDFFLSLNWRFSEVFVGSGSLGIFSLVWNLASFIFEGDEFRGFTVFQLDFDLGIGESLGVYIYEYNFDLYKLLIIRVLCPLYIKFWLQVIVELLLTRF